MRPIVLAPAALLTSRSSYACGFDGCLVSLHQAELSRLDQDH
ncbi:MAG TPA: hypothetical protein VJN19_09900 [Propionibacteriaceae bacterium]|nr:hypothetical protein [Propionibacteriaceae bacterium]